MSGISGEEEEQPASRRAGVTSVGRFGIGRRRLTEEDDGYGNKHHEYVVVADEGKEAWNV